MSTSNAAMPQQVQDRHGNWLLVAPVSGVILTGATRFEHRISRVTLVAGDRMASRWKRLGFFQPISELQSQTSLKYTLGEFLRGKTAFAMLKLRGSVNRTRAQAIRTLREELAILSLSQLGYGSRLTNAAPCIASEQSAGSRESIFFSRDDTAWVGNFRTTGKFVDLFLDETWKKFQRDFFYFSLLRLLRRDIKVDRDWLRDLRNAAILAGQSQSSSDLPQAFLWNVIALETLLTTKADKVSASLPQRAEALLGWSANWTIDRYEEKIESLYVKRCQFVHEGKRDEITMEDLVFSDDLLFNLFYNILRHPQLFDSKVNLIAFSRKVQAEHVLGIKSKIRPKTLVFTESRQVTDSLDPID